MLLGGLVECVGRVRATPRKLEKVALLADLLRQTRGREAELAAPYLTGTLPQGRIGIGWSTLQSGAPEDQDVTARPFGTMFWFKWNTLSGSYLAFISRNRA